MDFIKINIDDECGEKDEVGLNPFRKDASIKTKLINEETCRKIEWDRLEIERDLAKKDCTVDVPFPVIERDNSVIPVWNLSKYQFLLEDKMPDTVNPRLWEHGKLNLNTGLYKVTDKIYQVRGFDLANMSIIRGDTGWIVIGCLSSKETAEAAVKLFQENLENIPVSAIIITHSHIDHYGGVLGVLESKCVKDIKIYVPEGFLDAVIEENVNAGIAMSRRGVYMYGEFLPRDKKGQIDSGIGKYSSLGTATLSDNIEEISTTRIKVYEEKIIDGVTMQFQLTPNTEAPTEMNIYIPGEKSLCMAENCTATLHNIYTLRGAKVRDPVAWADYLQQAMDLFGDNLTSIFQMHNWPRHGNAYCLDYLSKQRDLYQFMNDQTLRLINKGYTIDDVGRMIEFPKSLSQEWYNSPFYGTVNTNVKAIYQRYMGWYNSNPVDLNKLLPEQSAKKYVEYMGGEDSVIEKAKVSFEEGDYQWVAEVTKHVIYANPDNRDAKLLCADALEQLGYIAESGPWRNEYLMGAMELRYGKMPMPATVVTDYVLDAIPLENIMNLFSIRIDGLATGELDFKLNFIIPDREEVASAEVKRGIFRYLDNKCDKDAVFTALLPKKILYELAITNNRPDANDVIVVGDIDKWDVFLAAHDNIDTDFNIMTPLT